MVHPHRGGPNDWAMRALPAQLGKMMEEAESGSWEPESGDLLIEFGHPIKVSESSPEIKPSIGFACLKGEWVSPAEGETVLLNDVPVLVKRVLLDHDDVGECEEGGTYKFCHVTVAALDA
jgi:hypothetical protein